MPNYPRYNKYGATKVLRDGIVFDSRREADRYSELKLLERARCIRDLRMQVPFEVLPNQKDENGRVVERAVNYIADFVYLDRQGRMIVEDVKGVKTEVYKLKKKLMLFRLGIIVQEV